MTQKDHKEIKNINKKTQNDHIEITTKTTKRHKSTQINIEKLKRDIK